MALRSFLEPFPVRATGGEVSRKYWISLRDRQNLVYRDFLDVLHTSEVSRVDLTRRDARFEYTTLQYYPWASWKSIVVSKFGSPRPKKNTRFLKNHGSDQNQRYIITLQKSTTWLNGWFGKLRLGARKIAYLKPTVHSHWAQKDLPL